MTSAIVNTIMLLKKFSLEILVFIFWTDANTLSFRGPYQYLLPDVSQGVRKEVTHPIVYFARNVLRFSIKLKRSPS